MTRRRVGVPFTVRVATEVDAPGIQRCISAAFAPYREAYTPAAFADTVPNTAEVVQRIRRMHVMVASTANDASRVVGTLSARVDAGQAHLRGMAVEPERQGTGVATALLRAMEAELRAKRVDRVTLDVSEPLRQAQSLYEGHGFRRTGRVSPFFGMLVYEYEKHLDLAMGGRTDGQG